MQTFDNMSEEVQENPKPLWAVDFKDDDAVKRWMLATYTEMKEANAGSIDEAKSDILAYIGNSNPELQDTRAKDFQTYPDRSRRRKVRISINHIYDMIEQQVSRETKYRPAVSVIPVSADHDDMVASTVVEKIIQAVWENVDIDSVFREHTRNTKVTNTSYILLDFDRSKGELHPDYLAELLEKDGYKGDPKKANSKDIKEALKKEKSRPRFKLRKGSDDILDRDGNPLYIDEAVRIGEITYKCIMSYDMFLQKKKRYEDVEWGFYVEHRDIEDLRAEYPDHANDIQESTNHDQFTDDGERIVGQSLVLHLWHKGTKRLDSGRHIIMTPDCVLENEPNELIATCLPWVRRVDVPIPGQLKGTSTLSFGKVLQQQINNLASLMIRGQALAAHPKWMAQAGTVEAVALGNDASLVFYKGNIPPRLEQPNPMAPSTFQLMESLEQKLGKVMGVHEVSRGEAPAGVKAGVALQFLGEQEDERSNASMAEHHKSIKDLAVLTVIFAATFYDESDERIEKLLGVENADLAKTYSESMLSRKYDIRLQSSSALPQQKSARMDAILQLKEAFPEKVDDDETLEMLGFGSGDKFISISTVNVRSAEAENDECINTGKTTAPIVVEDHLVHYRIHVRKLAERSLKPGGPHPRPHVEALELHVEATEMLMLEIGKKNPEYLKVVLDNYPAFPMYFKPMEVKEEEPIDPMQDQLLAQEQAMMEEQAMMQAQQPGAMPPMAPPMAPIMPGQEVPIGPMVPADPNLPIDMPNGPII